MGKIEVTFLGTAAGIPTKKRAHPAIHLAYTLDKEVCYLFDCGEGTQRQMLFAGLNFMKIKKIFITHWHGDHYLGLPGLVETMGFEGRKEPLTIYTPEPERTKTLLSIGYFSPGFEILYRNVPVEGSKIEKLVETDYFEILSISVEHTVPAVCYALVEKDRVRIDKEKLKSLGLPEKDKIYRILKEEKGIVFKGKKIKLEDVSFVEKGKKIVYSGDTRICENLKKISQNADLLIQDCTYFDLNDFEQDYGHASVEEVMDFIEKVNVKKVILTHISRRYKNLKDLKEKIKKYPNLEIAKDFMRIIL